VLSADPIHGACAPWSERVSKRCPDTEPWWYHFLRGFPTQFGSADLVPKWR